MPAEHEKTQREEQPDLQTQLEEIFGAVWESEAEWRLDDRISLALLAERRRREGSNS